ncbi:hypothetical protein KP509_20G064500 [Ceratopteris richardii]|nr:hypothetical protein KP509_20G064500 [Ceratopteris richardii]
MKTQEDLLKDLHKAVENNAEETELSRKVDGVLANYDIYYEAKQNACHQDILRTVSPEWKSPLEKAFLWLGGWRPSLAFQLVYALTGQMTEVELAEFFEGIESPGLSSLSASQLSEISELQTSTNKQEDFLGDEMAMLQQSFADQPLLSLAQAHHLVQAQEAKNDSHMHDMHDDGSAQQNIGDAEQSRNDTNEPDSSNDALDSAMQEKLNHLQTIAAKADNLRLTTLKGVLNILNTFQKAQYLVAAGKLQMLVWNIGEKLTGATASL